MPVFTFEKIPAPAHHRVSTSAPAVERRGVLLKFLDRFAVSRLKRTQTNIDRARHLVTHAKPSSG